jgi:hypothetical protein
VLAWVTCFVFADETTSLHQSLAEVLRDRYQFHGPARYTWALLYLPVVVVVLVVLMRDLRRVAPAVRNRLIPGGALYATGAVLLEPVVAKLGQEHGDDSLSFKIMLAVADSAQLIGLVLVFCAALVAAGRLADRFTFLLAPQDPRDATHR